MREADDVVIVVTGVQGTWLVVTKEEVEQTTSDDDMIVAGS